jgi:hypothetical protein
MSTLTTTITTKIAATESAAFDTGTASYPSLVTRTLQWTSGTGASQADKLWTDIRTLTASATEDLDLAGSLPDALGGSVVFATIKAVRVYADAGNTNDVQLTRPASNGVPLFLAAGDGIALGPDQEFFWHVGAGAGKTVTAATGDLLTITNSAGSTSVTYTIEIIGTSA